LREREVRFLKSTENYKRGKMNWYIARYNWEGGRGAFQIYDYLIKAETENVALGLALVTRPETKAEDWSFEKLSAENRNEVIHISSASN
jgi:hypothetical protein